MVKSNSTKARRQILFAAGAGLFGIASIVTGLIAKARSRRGPEAEASRLASRIDLPKGTGPMMEAFARDPEKVKRFRELTRWRKMRDQELRNA